MEAVNVSHKYQVDSIGKIYQFPPRSFGIRNPQGFYAGLSMKWGASGFQSQGIAQQVIDDITENDTWKGIEFSKVYETLADAEAVSKATQPIRDKSRKAARK